jgi:hypothetical protein
MFTEQIGLSKRSRAIITANTPDGPFSVRVWVNCTPFNPSLVDATTGHLCGNAKTIEGARKMGVRLLEILHRA